MTTDQTTPEPSMLYRTLTSFFLFLGILGLLFGATHWLSLGQNDTAPLSLPDALYNAAVALWYFVTWRAMVTRSRRVILLSLIVTVASVVYSATVGRGFNPVFPVANTVLTVGCVVLWRKGELR